MKKIFVLVMVLAMIIGCAGMRQVVDTGQQVLCNPTDQQKTEAQAILTFVSTGVQLAGMVISVPVTVAQVQTIFGVVQAGGCILATDLQIALAWFDEVSVLVQTKAMAGKKMAIYVPTDAALRAWVRGNSPTILMEKFNR